MEEYQAMSAVTGEDHEECKRSIAITKKLKGYKNFTFLKLRDMRRFCDDNEEYAAAVTTMFGMLVEQCGICPNDLMFMFLNYFAMRDKFEDMSKKMKDMIGGEGNERRKEWS